MQCSACRAVYSNALENCPRCKTPTPNTSSKAEATTAASPAPSCETQIEAASAQTSANASSASTLIEFPGTGRASRPQWRKDLSERVREIQERRSREAAREAEQQASQAQQRQRQLETALSEIQEQAPTPPLGLVPPSMDQAPVNPLVAAALRRIERAYQTAPHQTATRARISAGAATATAVARVAEEQYQNDTELEPSLSPQLPEPPPEAVVSSTEAKTATLETNTRTHNLVVVPAHTIAHEQSQKAQPRRIITEVVDDALLARLGAPPSEATHAATTVKTDHAPIASRLLGGIIDLLVVVFAATPFAAIIELTNGNWADWRVAASMSVIFILVMFLYLTASTALAGRTWGMSRVSIHAVDVSSGLLPTTRQAVLRSIFYILSLAACGLGVLYALMDAENRTAHDYLSGTIVVRD